MHNKPAIGRMIEAAINNDSAKRTNQAIAIGDSAVMKSMGRGNNRTAHRKRNHDKKGWYPSRASTLRSDTLANEKTATREMPFNDGQEIVSKRQEK
jgi:hypothetical protein